MCADQAFTAPYFQLGGGLSFQKDYNLHHVKFTHSLGSVVSVAGGWDFGKFFNERVGFRLGGEYLRFTSRGARIFSLDQTNSAPYTASAKESLFFLNGYIDIPVYKNWELMLGAGWSGASHQLMSGVNYKLNSWTIGFQYRRVELDYKARSYDPKTGLPSPLPPCCGISSTTETSGHAEDDGRPYDMVLIELRYEF